MRFCILMSVTTLLWACSQPTAQPKTPPVEDKDAGGAMGQQDAAPPKALDAIGETEARSILADAFRRAGFRILYDVTLASDQALALDGYDPVKKVGYEYIAPEEVAGAAMARAAASSTILVVGPLPREELKERVAKFVGDLLDAQEREK